MLKLIKGVLLFSLSLKLGVAFAMSAQEQKFIDNYTTEKLHRVQSAEGALRKIAWVVNKRVSDLELRMKELTPYLEEQAARRVHKKFEIEANLEKWTRESDFQNNPYSDAQWVQSTEKVLMGLCCQLETDAKFRDLFMAHLSSSEGKRHHKGRRGRGGKRRKGAAVTN